MSDEKRKSRRVKLFEYNQQLLVNVLNWIGNSPNNAIRARAHTWSEPFRLNMPEDMPHDYEVLSVNASWERGTIMILVYSSQFDIVPVGQEPERVYVDFRAVVSPIPIQKELPINPHP